MTRWWCKRCRSYVEPDPMRGGALYCRCKESPSPWVPCGHRHAAFAFALFILLFVVTVIGLADWLGG